MEESDKEKSGPEPMLEAWMKTASKYFETLSEMFPADPDKIAASLNAQASKMEQAKDSIESNMRMWNSLSSYIADMENIESFCQGINSVPEIFVKMTQNSWKRFFSLQDQWISKAWKLKDKTEAYNFDNLDQEAFNAWSSIYEEEFRKFLKMPQIGLTRGYQERANSFIDKFNLFQVAMSDFMHILYLPMEKSLKVMQQKLESHDEPVPSDYHDHYRTWVKVLEGHFMTLYKSGEYTRSLKKALKAMGEFMIARHEFFQDIIKTLPIPTEDDMDDLIKEIYELKKRVKVLEKKLNR